MPCSLPRLACVAAASLFAALPVAHAAPDLQWDLSYETALRVHPVAENEILRFWPARYPQRPIHERLASYSGEPIEASLLIEGPDGHAGDPVAHWTIKTRTTAQVCTLYKERKDRCKPLDPARTEAFIREVMDFRPLRITPSDKRKVGEAGGKPILLNYVRFLSVYSGGRALQRPIAALELDDAGLTADEMRHPEAGRLSNALARLMLTDEAIRKRQAQAPDHLRRTEFVEALRAGDTARVGALASADPALVNAGYFASSALALAVAANDKVMVERLLRHGARIDAVESAALKAAVRARNAALAHYLLSRGAQADPPADSLDSSGRVYETPLGIAAGLGDTGMAQLLIRHGVDVNGRQTRPPLAIAAHALHLPMMDLLIAQGAKPDAAGTGTEQDKTALALLLLTHAGGPGAGAGSAAQVEQAVRKLVAAGADVNRVDAICDTPYELARDRRSEPTMRLLQELGADPKMGERCLEMRGRIRRANASP